MLTYDVLRHKGEIRELQCEEHEYFHEVVGSWRLSIADLRLWTGSPSNFELVGAQQVPARADPVYPSQEIQWHHYQ